MKSEGWVGARAGGHSTRSTAHGGSTARWRTLRCLAACLCRRKVKGTAVTSGVEWHMSLWGGGKVRAKGAAPLLHDRAFALRAARCFSPSLLAPNHTPNALTTPTDELTQRKEGNGGHPAELSGIASTDRNVDSTQTVRGHGGAPGEGSSGGNRRQCRRRPPRPHRQRRYFMASAIAHRSRPSSGRHAQRPAAAAATTLVRSGMLAGTAGWRIVSSRPKANGNRCTVARRGEV